MCLRNQDYIADSRGRIKQSFSAMELNSYKKNANCELKLEATIEM